MKRKSLLFVLLMALFAPLAMNAQETLLVHDGTSTNQYVPFYGYYADEDQQNQMIYPATELRNMTGAEITQMVFHYSSVGYGSGVGTWTVSLGETRETTLNGLDNNTTLTEVFTGGLDALFNTTDKTLTITFANSYTYRGSNLLVEFSHVGDGSTYKQYYFYGETVTGASYCYGGQRNFLPKTTFTYEPASNCAKPTDLAVNYTSGATTATVTWSGNARSYNVDVNGTIEAVNGTSYTIRDLALATSYTVKVQADCGDEQSAWVSAGSFTTPCPDSYAIPYAYGFENADEMSCWTQEATELTTGYWYGEGNSYAHTGNGCYYFSSYNGSTDPQYLISPELSGIVNGVHVEFWYRKGPNGEESFKVGYSTTDNDPDSFIWDDEVTSLTATYQLYKVNYLAQVKYVAVQYTGADSYYIFLDDFSFTEVNPCLEPTNVAASNVTTTTATISWTAGFEEQEWDLYYTSNSSDVPDDATTPSISGILVPFYNLMSNNSLDPATTYYAYVRSVCGEEETSAWSTPAVFNTECEATALPYTYDFNDGELSVCWNIITTSPTYTGTQIAGLTETDYAFMFFRGTSSATLALVMPEVDANYPLNGYQITFDAAYYNSSSYTMTSGKLGIGIMTDPTDFSTFTLIEEVTFTENYVNDGFGTHTVRFNSYQGSGQYIAFQDIHTANGYVLVDNIEVTELPACLEPTNLTVVGGKNAVVAWEGNAESFDIAYSTDNTADPDDNIIDNTTENTFNLGEAVNLTEGDYYVWVRANCGTDGYSEWTSPVSFHVGYCVPTPSNVDGNGISNVTFGTGDYVVNNNTEKAGYTDCTSQIGAVQAGVEATVAITYAHTYTYGTFIWVDLDNSMSFEDSEIVYYGTSTGGSNPHTLNATILIPATQTPGNYRMRIGGADSGFDGGVSSANPCYTGSWACFQDYTLMVLEAPSCLAAGDVTVAPESITSTSAVISWTNNNGEEATYTVMQGETVLTTTAVDSYQLTGLTAATSYPAGTYTIISDCDETLVANVPAFTTLCDVIVVTESWSEGFENGLSVCWDQEGSGTWSVGTGDYSTSTGAHTGTYNAKITHSDYDNVTKLITPVLDLTALNNPKLTFWYINRSWGGDIDGFTVYYRTASDAAWTQIDATSEEHATWTEATYSLPNPSATYQIAFEMYDNYGYGVGIDDITIEEAPVYTLTINGYTSAANGWNLIASPVATSPDAVENMISNTYDLYRYNATAQMEWENYQQHQGDFDLVPGQGYLYANSETVELGFSGDLYDGNGEITLENAGWNLVGNPFYDAIASIGRDYYRMNSDHDGLIAGTVDETINAWEGIFVEAENPGEVLTFTPVFKGEKSTNSAMVINLSQNSVIDRAIVRFGGNSMTKFQLFENSTKLYIAQDGEDYAIVNSGNEGEMPVNFKAEKNGTYTISVNTENVSMDYLHLIDNMTGADIDLLANPSYTFNASTTDYASRFRLVFAAAEVETFAYYNGSEWVVNGNGTMQLVDMMGRVLSSENVNGVATVNTNELSAGVYVMRLVNGNNVKTQKIVVK